MAHQFYRTPSDIFGPMSLEGESKLRQEIIDLYDQVTQVVFLDHGAGRNRSGVELHHRLRKAKTMLEVYVGDDKEELRGVLHNATRELLVGVFKIDVDNTDQPNKNKEVPVSLTVQPTDGNMVVQAQSYSNDDIAGVSLWATVGNKKIEVSGTAKRAEGDKPDRAIGLTPAHGRALRKLGNQLIVEANEAVKAADADRRREKAKADQERSKSTKAERKVRAEREATQLLAEVQKELRYLRQTADEQRENADELHRLVEELQSENEQLQAIAKKKDYEARIAKRRANQAEKPKAAVKRTPAKKK